MLSITLFQPFRRVINSNLGSIKVSRLMFIWSRPAVFNAGNFFFKVTALVVIAIDESPAVFNLFNSPTKIWNT